MARKGQKADEIVAKLRQVDVLTAQGKSGGVRPLEQDYDGPKTDHVKHPKELEQKSARRPRSGARGARP